MKRLLFTIILITIVGQAWAQETNRHQFSSAPESARYEIVQSELGARITLKIDKYDRRVYLLVEGTYGLAWELMQVEEHILEDTKITGKVNYQVFTSGIGQKFTFLMNVNTGATWQLAEDTETGAIFWTFLG